MVAWIATSEEEASALKRGAVGHESVAMVTLQAVQATAAVPVEGARFVVPLAEQATLVPHHEFSDQIPVIDLSGDPHATIAAVAHAAATWGVFQVLLLLLLRSVSSFLAFLLCTRLESFKSDASEYL